MMKRNTQFIFTVLLVLLIFSLGTRIVKADDTASEENSDLLQEKVEEALLSEFNFEEIEKNLEILFPENKITFGEVAESLSDGDMERSGELFADFLSDRISYEFRENRKMLVYVILVSLTAAVFSNFAEAFQNRQVSDISFYVMYMLLMTLCLTSFRTAADGIGDKVNALLEFMRVLCPGFFLAVAFSSGSTSSLLFYNLVLFLIYAVELVIVRFLLPVINIYTLVRILGNLTGEDYLSEFASLIKKAVIWILRTMLACVAGINVVQGLLAPAIDTMKRSALTRTAEALPWVGNLMGGTAELVMGTAILIKNGIGMAGAAVIVLICAVPLIQMLVTAFLYKLAAAVVQPVSDKRITSCISGMSEAYELMVRVLAACSILFLLTIAVAAASTS